MATTIKLKSGSGAPLAGDLVAAEPALDLTNKRLYTEDSGGTVIEVGTNPTSLTTGTFTSTGIDDNATSTKLTVSDTGIDVTGTVVSDGLTVDGTGDLGTIGNGAFNAAAALGFQSDRAFFGYSSSQNALIQSGASKGVVVGVNSDTLDSGTRAALFASNGDISFYEDTGTTQAFFWDASAESLGIGTTSPSSVLTAVTSSNANNIQIRRNSTTTNDYAQLGFSISTGTTADNNAEIRAIRTNSPNSGDTEIAFLNRGSGAGPTERMRIDSSGNLLVSKTSADFGASAGFEVRSGGTTYAARSGGSALTLNRITSDGDIVTFRKDDSTVGSIGVEGSNLTIGTGDTGLQFRDESDAIRPFNISTNAARDANIDLGRASERFRDLYLSGGAYLGGTAAANKLDDYEEGVHVTTLTPGTSGTITLNSSFDTLGYTKIGRLVHITGSVTVSSVSSPVGNIQVSLPFVIASTSEQSERFGGLVQVNRSSINVNEFSYTGSEGNSYIVIQKASGTEISSDSAETFGGNEYIYFDFTYYTS